MKDDRFFPLTGSIAVPVNVSDSNRGMMIHAIAAQQCTVKVRFTDTIISKNVAHVATIGTKSSRNGCLRG
jgi:hypothetical protein